MTWTLDKDRTVEERVIPVSMHLVGNHAKSVVPLRMTKGVYYLLAAHGLYIDVGQVRKVSTGIRLDIPDTVCWLMGSGGKPVNVPVIAHVCNIPELFDEKGIRVVNPEIIPSTFHEEIVITVTNIGKKRTAVRQGDPIAAMYFTMSPVVTLGLEYSEVERLNNV